MTLGDFFQEASDWLDENIFVPLENKIRPAIAAASDATGLDIVTPYDELPDPPTPEPPTVTALSELLPELQGPFYQLQGDISDALAKVGYGVRVSETYRSPERQAWLWGVGRLYKAPGRTGIVTNIKTPSGMHPQRKAVDFEYFKIDPSADPNDLDPALAGVAANHSEMRWGGRFTLQGGGHDESHWESA